MTSDDKVGGWVKKGQNHDDVILECPPIECAIRLTLILKSAQARCGDRGVTLACNMLYVCTFLIVPSDHIFLFMPECKLIVYTKRQDLVNIIYLLIGTKPSIFFSHSVLYFISPL